MTYSFTCNRCGASISTVIQRRYRIFKNNHKSWPCPMKSTEIGTLARPDLAKHLNKTKYRGYKAFEDLIGSKP